MSDVKLAHSFDLHWLILLESQIILYGFVIKYELRPSDYMWRKLTVAFVIETNYGLQFQ